MYTTTVGRTFLGEYNKREKKNFNAKEFFEQVLFKYFFDEKKYLMWAQNSPFVQGINKKRPFFEPPERLERLEQFHEKIERGDRDASIAIGFPASEVKEYATTSGLVTDLVIPSDDEDIYLSWIGGTLSLGVAGGYAILFDNPKITYATFEGWKVYREFLNDPANDKLRGNQITTWNGQWLTLKFGKLFPSDHDFNYFLRKKAVVINEKTKDVEINTVEWSRLFFSLSNQFPSETQIAYIFSLGQTNKTIGFIPFQLKSGRRIHEVYQKLFGEENYRTNQANFETLFGKHIKRACELGNIGLQALEPKNLKKYFASDSHLNLKKTSIKQKKGESEEDFHVRKSKAKQKDNLNIINFRTYKTWLIAMISKNKTEISDYTRDIAATLVKYKSAGRKNDRKNLLEKEFFKTSKKEFLKALDKIVSDNTVEIDIVEKMNNLRDYIHFTNKDDFSYFILLLKFDYSYAERSVKNSGD